jgi:hypothetical protein
LDGYERLLLVQCTVGIPNSLDMLACYNKGRFYSLPLSRLSSVRVFPRIRPITLLDVYTQLDGLATQISPVGWTNESRASWMGRAAPEGARDNNNKRVQLDGRAPRMVRSRSSVGISAVCLLSRAQGPRKHILQPRRVLQPNANTYERARHAISRRPIQLTIMGQYSIRTREGEISSEAGTLRALERVKERLRRAGARECEREQPAEAAGGRTAVRGVVCGGLPFWVEDLGDGRGGVVIVLRGCVQEVADALGVRVDFGGALGEGA